MGKLKLEWDEAAEQRLQQAPFAVRKLARYRIERAARQQGLDRVSLALVEAVKNREMKS
jgi:hypothetical protein